MKNKLLLLTLILSASLLSNAQQKTEKAKVIFGKEEKSSKKITLEKIVGYDQSGIYVVKMKYRERNEIILEHYNNEMNQIESVEVALKQGKNKLQYESALYLNDKLYILSSFKNGKLKKNFLFIQSVNKSTLKPNKDIKKIAEISYEKKSRLNAGGFNYGMSTDSSKLMIYYNLPYDKGENERFGFHIYDNQINELWSKEVTLPYKEELFNVQNYDVSNDGDVFLLAVKYKEKAVVKRKGKPNYNYHVLAYSDMGKTLNEYPVTIEDNFLTDMVIAVNADKDIICAGFYSEKGTFSIKGSYFLKIDGKSKTIASKTFKEFGIDFITQNMTEREEKKVKKKKSKGKNVELYEYDLDRIILKEDGGAVLVGEQYYIRTVTTTSTGANGGTVTRTSYHYYYNDIIVVNLSSNGEIDWTEKIPKRQFSINDGGFYSSYALTVLDDRLFFVFNDNAKNLFYNGSGNSKIERFRGTKNAVVTLVELDSDGRQSREALFEINKADILTRTKVSKQISKNELILFGQRKKMHRFAKVVFDD